MKGLISVGTTVFERQRPSASVLDHALDGTRHSTFWLDDIPRPAYDQLDADKGADLVIVGGGYTGLWTAIRAKQRDPDAHVVLLEAARIGWAASGRNGGFCEASLTHGAENGMSRWPEEFEQLERLGRENLDGIEATVREFGMDADFERTGTIDVATEPHQVEWLREAGSDAVENGDDDTVYLDEAGVRAQVNSPSYLAGLWHKSSSALVHPAKLAIELARVAAELGVEIHENSPVQHLGSTGPTIIVHSGGNRVWARKVALATNVFPSLLKRNKLMTVPVYDYALMTEPLSATQLADIGWTNRQGISDVANQFHYYRQSADNRILFGGYDAVYFFGRKVRPSYEDRIEEHRMLASHFFTTFPQLEGLKFSHRWAGAIDSSTRFCAFFGTARGGRVAYAAGFTGLGVGATRFAADVMLDQLDGLDTERTRLRMVRERPLPFPPEPAASIGINATRWSMNQADHKQGKRNVLLKTLDALGLGFDS